MGIVKISYKILGDGSSSNNSSYSPVVDGQERVECQTSGADSESDPDDQESVEAGCELGLVGTQVCSIPYELYDLPDLKDILSLETWNSCLTEEERFSLSAYLPDMDQHTFWLTIKQLLGGNDIFFGSPLTELFERLRGGFYPPKVTRFREGLRFLQRRAFYHSLGSYHENMLNTFSDMKRLWDQCRLSVSIDERMQIWKSRKNHMGGVDPFDLNAYPFSEDLLSKDVETRAIMPPFVKKPKYMEGIEEKANIMTPPVANGLKLVAPKSSGRGVLKIKTPGTSKFQTHVQKGMPSDAWASCRPQPKGVLKIVPKAPTFRQEQPRVLPTRLEPNSLVEAPVLQTSRFSPLPQSRFDWNDSDDESPLMHQTFGGTESYRGAELRNCTMDQQRVEYKNGTTGSSRNNQSWMKRMKRPKDMLFDEFIDVQEHNFPGGNHGTWNSDDNVPRVGSGSSSLKVRRYAYGREKDWQNSVRENREPIRSPVDPYSIGSAYYQGDRLTVPTQENRFSEYPRMSEAVSGMPDNGTDEHDMFTTSFDQVKRHRDVNFGGSANLYDSPAVPNGLQDEFSLPVTYKRRKGQSKHSTLDFVKPLTVDPSFRSRLPKEMNNLDEGAKGIKIRFKK